MTNDKILIGDHSFETETTITQPKANGDYHITLNFGNVPLETLEIIKKLYEHPKEIEFKSEYAAKHNYHIDYIVMTDINVYPTPNGAQVFVKCLSDTIIDLIIE